MFHQLREEALFSPEGGEGGKFAGFDDIYCDVEFNNSDDNNNNNNNNNNSHGSKNNDGGGYDNNNNSDDDNNNNDNGDRDDLNGDNKGVDKTSITPPKKIVVKTQPSFKAAKTGSCTPSAGVNAAGSRSISVSPVPSSSSPALSPRGVAGPEVTDNLDVEDRSSSTGDSPPHLLRREQQQQQQQHHHQSLKDFLKDSVEFEFLSDLRQLKEEAFKKLKSFSPPKEGARLDFYICKWFALFFSFFFF